MRKAVLTLCLLFPALVWGQGTLGPQGDITAVAAGTGLTGGAVSGPATLNVVCGTGLTCNADSVTINTTTVPMGSGTLNYVPLWTPNGNTLGNSIMSQNGVNLVLTGTGTASHFYFSTNEDTYIRAGKVAGFVSIGDVNSGGVSISSASYTTTVQGALSVINNTTLGNATTDTTTINGVAVVTPPNGVSDFGLSVGATAGHNYGTVSDTTANFNVWHTSSPTSMTFRNSGGGGFTLASAGDLTATGNTILGDNSADTTTINGIATITGANADQSLTIANGGGGGRTYQLISSATASGLNPQKFSLYDPNTVGTVFSVDASGNITDNYSHTVKGVLSSHRAVGTTFAGLDSGGSGIVARDTTAVATGVGGGIIFEGVYTGTTVAGAAGIKAMKVNGTDGHYSFDLVFGGRANGAGLAEGCRLYGDTKILNCIGGLQINGSNVTAFTTNNAVPKGNGSGLVASGITDNGTDITLDSSSSVTISPAGYIDHDISLNLFGSTLGETYINGTTIGFGYEANTTASGCINCLGYQLNTTQFRDLTIADGKNAAIVTFTGSDKSVDFNGDFTKFGASDGHTYIYQNQINSGFATNALSALQINRNGFGGGVTQFRDLDLLDGKGATACYLTGSTKTLNCVGGLQVNGTSVVTTASVSGTTNTLAKFTSANAVGNSSITDTGALVSTTLSTYVATSHGDGSTGEFMIGSAGDATNGRNGINHTVFSDGNNYIDYKTFSGGYNVFRTGGGAESGAARNWMTVFSATGNAQLYGNSTLGDSPSDYHFFYGNSTVYRDDGGSLGNRPQFSINNPNVTGAFEHRAELNFVTADAGGTLRTSTFQAEAGRLYLDAYASTHIQDNTYIAGSVEIGDAIGDTLTVSSSYSTWSALDAVWRGAGSVYIYADYNGGGGNLYLQDNPADVTIVNGNFGVQSSGTPTAQLQVGAFVTDPGSYLLSNWNASGSRVSAYVVTQTDNGGWDDNGSVAGPQLATQPALVLARNGRGGESYANFVEFKVGRAQNSGVSAGGSALSAEARSKLDISLTYNSGAAAGTNVLSLISPSESGTYTALSPSYRSTSLVSAAGMLTSLGTANSTFADVADVGVSGARTRNFARASDYLDDTNMPDAYSGYFYAVNYPGVLSHSIVSGISPRNVYESLGYLVCTLASCAADFRTQLNYASSRTGIKDVRGRTFTISVWAKRASGTGTLGITGAKYADNDTFISQNCAINSTTWTRCVATGTTNSTSRTDNSELRFYMSAGSGTANIGIYFYGVQIEEGGQVTPYVRSSDQLNTSDVVQSNLGVGGYAYSGTDGSVAVYAEQPGSSSNGYTITFSTGGPAGGTFTDGRDATYSYQTGVTTTADFCTDLAASVYMTSVYCPTVPTVITATGAYTLTGAEDAHIEWTHRASFGGDASDPWVILNVGHDPETVPTESVNPDNRTAEVAMRVGLTGWGGTSQPVTLSAPPWTDRRGAYPSGDRPGAPYVYGDGFQALEVNGVGEVNGTFRVTNLGDAGTFGVYQSITGLDPACTGCNTADTAYITLTGTHGTAAQTGTALYITNDMADNAQAGSVNRGLIISVLNADTNTALHVDNGNSIFDGVAQFNANVTIDNGVGSFVVGASGVVMNSMTVTAGASFGSGPSGLNHPNGYHQEWLEEYLMGIAPANAGQFGWHSTDLVSGVVTMTGTTTRPGILQVSTSTSASARFMDGTWTDMIDLSQYDDVTWEWTGGFPTLSTSGERYQFFGGLTDTRTSVTITDGCGFAYDEGDVMPNPTTGDTGGISGDFWSIWCMANGVRTGYKLDGTASEDSFTTLSRPVAALTLPSTNIYHLKVVMEGSTKARFWMHNGSGDMQEVGRITTNIPTGSARLTGAGYLFIKSVGTTARTVLVDNWSLSYDLTNARY